MLWKIFKFLISRPLINIRMSLYLISQKTIILTFWNDDDDDQSSLKIKISSFSDLED